MRRLPRVLVATASALLLAPGATSASPHRNKALTINATPNPIFVGEAVLVYGQLNLASPGHQPIRLFQSARPGAKFTMIQKTTTDASGFYEFPRAEGTVPTNSSWFVRGPAGSHSRTVRERVAASVALSASTPTGVTGQSVTYSGTILPASGHAGEPIDLQSLLGSTPGRWVTIATGMIAGTGGYSITHRFVQPGAYTLRARFGGDTRNLGSSSDEVTSVIQQAEKPFFTIFTSSPTVQAGQAVTISGVLYAPGSTSVRKAGAVVALYGHEAGEPDTLISSTVTAPDGSYSFALSPTHNEFLQASTTLTPPRTTAHLFEGVTASVSIAAASGTGSIGQAIRFTGTVTPDAAGRTVDLQVLGHDGRFHTVKSATVNAFSAFSLQSTFGSTGVRTVRARLPAGEGNLGGSSPPVLISISLPELSSLPPAS